MRGQVEGNISQYAAHRGISQPAVSSAIKSGRLERSVRREGKRYVIDFAIADQEWARNTGVSDKPAHIVTATKQASPPPPAASKPAAEPENSDEEMSFAEARTQSEIYKAKTAELEYRRKAGELLDRAETRASVFDAFKVARDLILAAPPRIVAVALAAKTENEAILAVKDQLHTVLRETADAIESSFGSG